MTHRISQVSITTDYGIGAVIIVRPMVDEDREDDLQRKFNLPALDFQDLPFEVRKAIRAWVRSPRVVSPIEIALDD